MKPTQRHRPAGSASAAAPPRSKAAGACRGVGEGRGLEVNKLDPERHHRWGRDSCEVSTGLDRDPTGKKYLFRILGFSRVCTFNKETCHPPHKPHC